MKHNSILAPLSLSSISCTLASVQPRFNPELKLMNKLATIPYKTRPETIHHTDRHDHCILQAPDVHIGKSPLYAFVYSNHDSLYDIGSKLPIMG